MESRKDWIFRIGAILCGSFLASVSINTFLVPHHLLSGGVSGLAILFHFITGLPAGMYILILNVPIFLVGARHVNREFATASLFGMLSLTMFLALTTPLGDLVHIQDTMLAALFGGLISGLGIGLVFRQRASMGGTDILAVIVRRYLSLDIGTVLLAFNLVVISFSVALFGIERALYTLVSMMASSYALNKTQDGFEVKKSVFIITDRPHDLTERILDIIHRGATILHGEGAYTHREKQVVFCVVTITQLARVKRLVQEIDPAAFMTVTDTSEVLGRGFRRPSF